MSMAGPARVFHEEMTVAFVRVSEPSLRQGTTKTSEDCDV